MEEPLFLLGEISHNWYWFCCVCVVYRDRRDICIYYLCSDLWNLEFHIHLKKYWNTNYIWAFYGWFIFLIGCAYTNVLFWSLRWPFTRIHNCLHHSIFYKGPPWIPSPSTYLNNKTAKPKSNPGRQNKTLLRCLAHTLVLSTIVIIEYTNPNGVIIAFTRTHSPSKTDVRNWFHWGYRPCFVCLCNSMGSQVVVYIDDREVRLVVQQVVCVLICWHAMWNSYVHWEFRKGARTSPHRSFTASTPSCREQRIAVSSG